MTKSEEMKKKQSTEENVEFVETLLNVRRVAKVVRGGRRFGFSALVVVGDRNGKLGIAFGKGREVSTAISKAFKRARKTMFVVPLHDTTIPFKVEGRHGASRVLIRAASKGTGVIAGGAVRSMMEAVGVKDVLAKSIGSKCPQNVARATVDAFMKLRSASHIAHLRGKTVRQLIEGSDVTA